MTNSRVVDWQERFEQALQDIAVLYSDGRELIKNLRAEIARLQREEESRFVLDVPYFSQWGPGADYVKRGDCGPGALTGAIHYLTDATPTVDDVAKACDPPMKPEDRYSSFGQLSAAAKHYGLKPHYIRPMTGERIIAEIRDRARPVLVLVKYDVLDTPGDPNQDDYDGAHFVLIVGVDLGPGPRLPEGRIIFHDPDRLHGDTFGAFRETPWTTFMAAMGRTSETPGNSYNNHGMVFESE